MQINEAVINHYRCPIIPIYDLKKRVMLNEKYLSEKPTWFEVNGQLQYFKIRNDFRLFTEQFFSKFGKEIMGLDTVDYTVATMRIINPIIKSTDEEVKNGLLSVNFQNKSKNYYLVSEMMSSEISDFVYYGGYSLKSLLKFFKDILTKEDYNINELFLIKLFIADAFMHQEDRNPNNIGFEIPAISNVPYKNRLRPVLLEKAGVISGLQKNQNGDLVIDDLLPSKVYDNERILGIDHKDVFNYTQGQMWLPLFPYSEETLFETQSAALNVSKELDDADPNLLYLFIDYPEICRPIFERLTREDEYKKILEEFNLPTSQIRLSDKEIDYINYVIQDKKKVLKRVLEIGK